MGMLHAALWPVEKFNDIALAIGRVLAISALALMVVFILAQVFFRYVMGDALNWSEEAARFLMLWMTGLIAPLAYRQGGFVAIDMLERALPKLLAGLLVLTLLGLAMVVLVTCLQLGWANVDSLTGRGRSATLRIPMDWLDMKDIRFRNQWAYASLFVGFVGLTVVNIELILRQVITLFGGGGGLKPLGDAGPID